MPKIITAYSKSRFYFKLEPVN